MKNLTTAEGAIAQVRERNYPQLVQEFADRLLLVGINYDKKTKKHECRIEKWGGERIGGTK